MIPGGLRRLIRVAARVRMVRAGVVFVCVFLMGAGVTGASVPASKPTGVPALRETIRSLIDQLGHPRFEVRTEATARLLEAEPNLLPALVKVYRAQTDHEMKLRLRYVIEYVYYRRLMSGQVGFLGVSLGSGVMDGVYDPSIGREVACVLAYEVLEGYAAEKAGLQDGDLIVGVDGKPTFKVLRNAQADAGLTEALPRLPGQPQQSNAKSKLDAFTAEVKRREPGSTMLLRVLRCGPTTRKIQLAASKNMSRVFEGATWVTTLVPRAQRFAGRKKSFRMAGGLRVVGLAAKSPASEIGLHIDDVVVAVDAHIVPVGTSGEQLADLCQRRGGRRKATLEVAEIQELTLEVTLGARGVDMMNWVDKLAAQMRFAEWWRRQSGEKSIRRQEDPRRHPTKSFPPKSASSKPSVLP